MGYLQTYSIHYYTGKHQAGMTGTFTWLTDPAFLLLRHIPAGWTGGRPD